MFYVSGECGLSQNLVIVIAGPTASGKSGLAVDVAVAMDGVVINADSMQVYKNTPILSACPSDEDKAKVPHVLYEILDASKNSSVTEWLDLCVAEIKKAWKKKKTPVVVGGTGLYIDNLINGTTPIPETSLAAKEKVSKLLGKGLEFAYAELLKVDEITAKRLSPNDTTRIRRGLEVFYDTKVPLSEWHKKPMVKKIPEAKFLLVKILPPKAELDLRIDKRLESMISSGALDEVEKLKAKNLDKNLPAMKALGVPEFMDLIDGKVLVNEAVYLAQVHTHQYAKRQITWFKNKLKADVVIDKCYTRANKNVLKKIISVAQRALTL